MYKDKTISLILASAGTGNRAKQGKNKLLVSVGSKTCIERTFQSFDATSLFDQIIITYNECDKTELFDLFVDKKVDFILGGNTRTQSVKNALEITTGEIVLIHDGARPFISERNIIDCIESVIQFGSGITAISSRDTICKSKDGNNINEYLGKSELYSVQTPQGFKTADIKRAYACAKDKVFNDDGEVYAQFINTPRLVLGNADNIKITYPEDMLKLSTPNIKFGVGFDCHKLVENRKLILGGIEIAHDKGLLGHSDADVLTHAIMDAILSALALRDIGYHFPDTDPKFKNADSVKLLEHVLSLIKEKGYAVSSVSAVIMAEKPKLKNYIPLITENLAKALNIDSSNIGLTATTLEGIGIVGREEGICVHANAILKQI